MTDPVGLNDPDHGGGTGPPEFDQAAVSRVVPRVEITNVELVGMHFERDDDGTEAVAPADVTPNFAISVEWVRRPDELVCVLGFATSFDDDDPAAPYTVVARFRLTYALRDGDDLTDGDLTQFAHWNASFNAWPYWRELVSSVLNRGQLPRFLVPVMRMPRADATDASLAADMPG